MEILGSIMQENYEEFISWTSEDKEYKETIKNASKKLETPAARAMPCKINKIKQNSVTRGKSNEIKSKHACLHDCVWENCYRIIMKTILQEKEIIHCSIAI